MTCNQRIGTLLFLPNSASVIATAHLGPTAGSHNYFCHVQQTQIFKVDTKVVFPCRGCGKAFKCPQSLMKHLGQTQCSSECHPKLRNLLNMQHNLSFASNQLQENLAVDNDKPQDFEFLSADDDANLTPDALNDNAGTLADNATNAILTPETHRPCFQGSTRDFRVEAALMKIVSDSRAPLGIYRLIMEWAKDAFMSGHQFCPKTMECQSQMKLIEEIHKLTCLQPKFTPLPLKNCPNPIKCVHFDFKSHFESLINDPNLNHPKNLVVNPTDPFLPFVPADNRLGEILTGFWCAHAVATMVSDKCEEFVFPLVISTDKTHTSSESEHFSHPVFSLLQFLTARPGPDQTHGDPWVTSTIHAKREERERSTAHTQRPLRSPSMSSQSVTEMIILFKHTQIFSPVDHGTTGFTFSG